MGSRLLWIALAGVALVAGIAFQERDWMFAWAGETANVGVELATERAVEARVDEMVERMQVVGSDGRTVNVPPQTKRELGDAVRRLVAAEANLAVASIRGSSGAAEQEARSRRDAAHAEVERLSTEIGRLEALSDGDRRAIREQIQQDVRATIRTAIRD